MKRLAKKVALITGASSGIGAAIARRFAEEGAIIYAYDINEPACQDWQVAANMAEEFRFVQGDVRVECSISQALNDAVEDHGTLDIVVNAVGVTGSAAGSQLDVAEWDRVLNLNLRSVIVSCYHALNIMAEQGSGSVVNVASFDGIVNSKVVPAYNTAKGGIIAATKYLAQDYAHKGVRVNSICPGIIETSTFDKAVTGAGEVNLRDKLVEAQQMGRFGQPVEVANAALFLASDEASYITGHSLVVDGGLSTGQPFGFTRGA